MVSKNKILHSIFVKIISPFGNMDTLCEMLKDRELNTKYAEKIKQWESFFKDSESDKIENEILDMLEKHSSDKELIYYLAAQFYTEFSFDKTIYYIKKAIEEKPKEIFYLKLFQLYIRKGELQKALNSVPENINNSTIDIKIKKTKADLHLLREGLIFPKKEKSAYISSTSVLYLLHNSLPYHSGGYATRAHGLMSSINSNYKINMEGITRLGYPRDILRLGRFDNFSSLDIIDTNQYQRLKSCISPGSIPYKEYIIEYSKAIVEIAKIKKPFVIHGASNFYNGLAAVYSAKLLGVKSIYEIRGLWEITRISREPDYITTDMFALTKNMETTAAMHADIVLTITQALKREMIKRGVSEEKIIVLPNGVDTQRFKPINVNKELITSLNLNGKVVIGYVGSIVQYEGLDDLIRAIRILVDNEIINFSVLIVGDGDKLVDIKYLVSSLNLEPYFIFTGRVPYDEVEKYYSIIDIAPFPRKGQPVTEMVSPLKPFEAMAMEKAVIASDVAALSEIVQDEYNGLLFEKDNVDSLANCLKQLIINATLRKKLGKNAREWVVKERDWKIIAAKLNQVYEDIRNV